MITFDDSRLVVEIKKGTGKNLYCFIICHPIHRPMLFSNLTPHHVITMSPLVLLCQEDFNLPELDWFGDLTTPIKGLLRDLKSP